MNRFLLSTITPLFAMLLLVVSGEAHALCVGPPVKHVFVGDTASDAACTFNDVQSAIDDASTNPSCTSVIHVTREHTYTDQHLTISNRNVSLAAWGDGVSCTDIANQCVFFSCPLPPAATNPLVTFVGHDGDSVIHIDGASNVSLLNLSITGANLSADQSGGGIYYDGTGSLSLTSTTVNLNYAGYGAGINMNGDGGPASLYLNSYSEILVNTAAVSGGGIRMSGTSRLYALQPHTLIGFNHAPNGYGGGIEVIGPARADIGSPGFNGLAAIYDNDAQYGGGISISGGSDDQQDAIARIFTTDSANPVQVSNNTASHTGGGIYLKPFNDIVGDKSSASFCAFDFRIEDNIAQEGAAIYADLDSSPTIGINQISNVVLNSAPSNPLCTIPENAVTLGATACAPGVTCNTIANNITEDNQDTPTAGAAILIQTESELSGDRVIMRGNQAAHAIRAFDPLVNALSNCLIVDNSFSAEMVLVENEGTYTEDGGSPVTQFSNCTISHNAIAGESVFRSARGFKLQNSIIDQPGVPTLNYSDAAEYLIVNYVLTNDRSTLPDTDYIHQGEPTFIDAANADYHLTPASLGVDFAPEDSTTSTLDLDRKPRVVDLSSVANNFGPVDLGAFEVQLTAVLSCAVADTIFCNGFELAN